MGCCFSKKELVDLFKQTERKLVGEVQLQNTFSHQASRQIEQLKRDLDQFRTTLTQTNDTITSNKTKLLQMNSDKIGLANEEVAISREKQKQESLLANIKKQIDLKNSEVTRLNQKTTKLQKLKEKQKNGVTEKTNLLSQLLGRQKLHNKRLESINSEISVTQNKLNTIQKQLNLQKAEYNRHIEKLRNLQEELFDNFVFEDLVQVNPQEAVLDDIFQQQVKEKDSLLKRPSQKKEKVSKDQFLRQADPLKKPQKAPINKYAESQKNNWGKIYKNNNWFQKKTQEIQIRKQSNIQKKPQEPQRPKQARPQKNPSGPQTRQQDNFKKNIEVPQILKQNKLQKIIEVPQIQEQVIRPQIQKQVDSLKKNQVLQPETQAKEQSEVHERLQVSNKFYQPQLHKYRHKRFGVINLEQASYISPTKKIIFVHMARNMKKNIYQSWLQSTNSIFNLKFKKDIFMPINFNFTSKNEQEEGIGNFIFENYQVVLKTELQKRLNNKHYLSQPQLWFILYKVASVGQQLQQKGKKIGNIHPINLLFNRSGDLKIFSLFSLPAEPNNFEICTARKNEIVNAYLAPEELTFSGIKKNLNPQNIDASSSLAEVFCLGITLLSAGTLQDANKIYQRRSTRPFSFDKIEMDTFMEKFKQKYSELLYRILQKMLEINPQKRIQWKIITKALEKYQSQILKFKKLTYDKRDKIRERVAILISIYKSKAEF